MSLNLTPSSERLHISFFGLRNAGKSSLVNAVTGQSLSVVSDVKGTTTDPVKKAMELLPIGPVVIIDTPGIDDIGELGELRVRKAKEVLSKTDIAVLVTDKRQNMSEAEKDLILLFKEKEMPYIIAYNKSDLYDSEAALKNNEIAVSALTGYNVQMLKELIAKVSKVSEKQKVIVSDLLSGGDIVILVTPIDKAAPKGRLILPQQMTIRDILDAGAIAITCKETELPDTLSSLNKKPKMVITDSQVFEKVSGIVPLNIPLTSFSILMARYKGNLNELVKGAAMMSRLKDGDKVLISEGCTHHRQCNDIGTVKLPGWIESLLSVKPEFSFTSGGEFPDDLSDYRLVIHCGGCMLNEKEMIDRIGKCVASAVPIVNYGVAIAHLHGILKRSLELFPKTLELLE